MKAGRVVMAALRAAGPRAELPAVLFELEERIGPLTSDVLDGVRDRLASPWRSVDGFEWHMSTGWRLREEWLAKVARRPDPLWTPTEVTRMNTALALQKWEAATFSRLVALILHVNDELAYSGSVHQAVLDEAWRRLDLEKVAEQTRTSPMRPERPEDPARAQRVL